MVSPPSDFEQGKRPKTPDDRARAAAGSRRYRNANKDEINEHWREKYRTDPEFRERVPVENRNAVADLPLREALSAIRSREKRLADAREREARVVGPAQLCVTVDGEVLFGEDAIRAIPALPPPSPSATPSEIADDLVAQLQEAASTEPAVTTDHLRDACIRRFGEKSRPPVLDVYADGIIEQINALLRMAEKGRVKDPGRFGEMLQAKGAAFIALAQRVRR